MVRYRLRLARVAAGRAALLSKLPWIKTRLNLLHICAAWGRLNESDMARFACECTARKFSHLSLLQHCGGGFEEALSMLTSLMPSAQECSASMAKWRLLMLARIKWDFELDSKYSSEQLPAHNKDENFTLNCK
jgi:hypothetical protein